MKLTKRFLALVCAILTLTLAFTSTAVPAFAASSNVVDQTSVKVRNLKTGQYMNVDYGNIANGTPVRCYPNDGSIDQVFNLVMVSNNVYRIYLAMTDKVCLDVYRGSSPLKSGQKLDVWRSGEDTLAQNLTLYSLGSNKWIIRLAGNCNLAISSSGSNAQLRLTSFNPNDPAQQWYFEKGEKVIDITKSNNTNSGKFVLPLKSSNRTNIVTQKFGNYYSGNGYHLGTDLSGGGSNVSVCAIADGIVVYTQASSSSKGYGNLVIIKHSSIYGKTFYSAYGHLKHGSIVVTKGQFVSASQKLGVMGSTGYSTGNHLHLAVYSASETTQPAGYSSSKPSNGGKISGIRYYDPMFIINTQGQFIQ